MRPFSGANTLRKNPACEMGKRRGCGALLSSDRLVPWPICPAAPLSITPAVGPDVSSLVPKHVFKG